MPLFRPKENNSKLNFLIKYKKELDVIGDTVDVLYKLEEIDILYMYVDDMSLVNDIILSNIYKRKYKVFVFVNSKFIPTQFTNIIKQKILKYFSNNIQLKCSIIYNHYNFPQKDTFIKMSEFKVSNESKIQYSFENPIFYIGQYGTSGYATAAKGYIAKYVIENCPIEWYPLYFDDTKLDKNFYVDSLAESAVNYKLGVKLQEITSIVHCTPDLYPKMITEKSLKKYKQIIGFCTWESNKLPTNWSNFINIMDEIWVPSEYNKIHYVESGVKIPIKVVPHVWFKQKLFNKNNIKIYDFMGNLIPTCKYTYYTIGEFTERKGIIDAIKTFDKLYNNNKNIQLIIKTSYKEYNIKNLTYCIESIKSVTKNLGKSIFLIIKNISNLEMLCIHSIGDCYISFTRGEGFGLTIFDALNYYKPIIATGYSGHIDFLGKDYSGLINYELVQVSGMDKFSNSYTKDQLWAMPNLDHAYTLMEYQIK